jgi:hypothetical protein
MLTSAITRLGDSRQSGSGRGVDISAGRCDVVKARLRVQCVARWLVLGVLFLPTSRAANAQGDEYEANILPTASLYGGMGLLEMRNARFMPDGYLALNADVKSPDDRIALTFQALPWMELTFRYSINYALAPIGQRALYDRSFDTKIRLFEEGLYTPQIAVGLQDFIGTGVYSAEYFVASKRFGPVDVTAGMGWGRLASRAAFANPLGLIVSGFNSRPTNSNTGGEFNFNDFFRGPNAGMFGGIEYETPLPNLTFKLEYSSDDYAEESKYHGNPSIHPKNYAPVPVNAGFSYRFWSNVDLGVAYIGGRELSVDATVALNPTEPNWPARLDPQPPFVARPERVGGPITKLEMGSDAPSTGDAWPNHYIDLTALESPDGKPPDPSLFHEGEWRVVDVFQKAGLRVTDGWISGDTLVAQVDLAGPPGPPCRDLMKEGSLPVPQVILVARDWNPIETCTASAAAGPPHGAQAQPSVEWQADTIAVMRRAIEEQKLLVQGISIAHGVVKVEIENDKYLRDAEAVSRTLRALSGTAPADIAVFEVTTTISHAPLTTVTMPRTEVDAAARGMTTPAELWESTILSDAPPDTKFENGARDPNFSWSVFPSIQEDVFDPNNPVYFGVGISGSSHTELLPGWVVDGEATYDVYNDFGSINRPSNSLLPHVRTDIVDYLQKGSTGINDLTTSYYFKPAAEVYARLTVGYIESMFAGVGGEVLYRPFGQRWSLGADIYDVYQRSFDDLFSLESEHVVAGHDIFLSGLQSYHVVTGHVSLYVETPWENVTAVLRGGRYLAGDYGATLELYRRFDTGIIVGAWATITNVPFSTFGEGSFDKGIRIVIPMEWVLPFGTSTKYEFDLRPIQRDGGQPLDNDAELYDATQPSSYGDMERQWPHVFE